MEEAIEKIKSVISEHWDELINKPNVLNVGIAKKVVDGVKTDKDAIVVYVSSKIPKKCLTKKELIPKFVSEIPTDVIELSTQDFELGPTEVSKKPLEIQRRIASGVKH